MIMPQLLLFDEVMSDKARPCSKPLACVCHKCVAAKQLLWHHLGNADTWFVEQDESVKAVLFLVPIGPKAVELHGAALDRSLLRHTTSFNQILDHYARVLVSVPDYSKRLCNYLERKLMFNRLTRIRQAVVWHGSHHDVTIMRRGA